MRVVIEGVLQHVPGHLLLTGWSVQLDEHYDTINAGEGARKLAACVLIHIGRKFGVELVEASVTKAGDDQVEPPALECFDAQREALDVIAMARWREQGT